MQDGRSGGRGSRSAEVAHRMQSRAASALIGLKVAHELRFLCLCCPDACCTCSRRTASTSAAVASDSEIIAASGRRVTYKAARRSEHRERLQFLRKFFPQSP